MSRALSVIGALALLAGPLVCGLLGPPNPAETDPSETIGVQVGQTFEIVTLWDGTHLTAADASVVEADYDQETVTLVSEEICSRRSFGFGGLLLFYDIATFRALAPGETEIMFYVPNTAWREEYDPVTNPTPGFVVVVEP